MLIVAESAILGAALRSAAGASNALLRQAAFRRLSLLLTAPLVADYRSHLVAHEQRLAHGRTEEAVERFLAAVATTGHLVRTNFQWRPRLADSVDELVLQAAVIGRADVLVTLRPERFGVARSFGVAVTTPTLLLERAG